MDYLPNTPAAFAVRSVQLRSGEILDGASNGLGQFGNTVDQYRAPVRGTST